jgi:hypothetical protein
MTSGDRTLTIAFHSPKLGRNRDHITVDLATHKLLT